MNQFEQDLVDLIPRLRRFARALTKDTCEADDLCQAVIEKALRNQERKRSDGRLDGWVFMIARNQWLDQQRRSRRTEARLVSIDDDSRQDRIASVGSDDDAFATIAMRDAVSALPQEQREAAALVWVEGYSYKEAARLLSVPIGTLTSRLSRARKWLITQMEAI